MGTVHDTHSCPYVLHVGGSRWQQSVAVGGSSTFAKAKWLTPSLRPHAVAQEIGIKVVDLGAVLDPYKQAEPSATMQLWDDALHLRVRVTDRLDLHNFHLSYGMSPTCERTAIESHVHVAKKDHAWKETLRCCEMHPILHFCTS